MQDAGTPEGSGSTFHLSGGPKRRLRDLQEEVNVRPLRRLRREEEPPELGVCAGRLREAEAIVADTRRTEVEPGEAVRTMLRKLIS